LKPLLIILKTLIIGYLWSIVFIDGVRVVLLINWHFDIFMREHWTLLNYKWNSGAAISKSEMAFFLIIVSAIPLWLAGWVGLCLLKWEKAVKKIILSPLYLYRKLTLKTKAPVVVKKKSTTEESTIIKKPTTIKKVAIKKAPLPSVALMQSNINSNMMASSSRGPSNSYPTANKKNPEMPTNHALFNFDEDDFDLDFDFDKKTKEKEEDKIPSALMVDKTNKEKAPISIKDEDFNIFDTNEKPSNKKENKNKSRINESHEPVAKESQSHTPVLDILKQKGYEIIPAAIIKGTTIDYVAVSKDQMILCLIDKETGDWLADEEKFNDEEPLWFSESSHRISPVRKVDIARDIIKTKLAVADLKYEIIPYVIIQAGNIINAEDMFDIWGNMNINVTRINRGSPKEIKLFSKDLANCEDKSDKETIEKLKKLLRSLA